jgi:hypothetical protein
MSPAASAKDQHGEQDRKDHARDYTSQSIIVHFNLLSL